MKAPSAFLLATTVYLALLCWICFFNGIHILYPLDKTEALQTAIAQSMFIQADWVTPSIDGLPYFDKPPLPYWIGSLLLHLAPQEVWLPRLGAAFAGSIGLIATFVLSMQGNQEISYTKMWCRAVIATTILALMPAYIGFSRIALHDIYLTTSITIALASFFLLTQSRETSARLQIFAGCIIGASLGVAMLAKGLLSLALTLPIACLFLILSGPKSRIPLTNRFIIALLLCLLVVALPWHLAAFQANGNLFLQSYFGRTQINRFASQLDNHSGPWYFYLLAYPALTAPWGFLSISELIRGGSFNPRRWRHAAQDKPLFLFCSIWVLFTILLLSLASTKLPHYILPCLPPSAIAASYFFLPSHSQKQPRKGFCQLLLAFTAFISFAAALLLGAASPDLISISNTAPNFSLALRSQLFTHAVVVGFVILGISAGLAAWYSSHPKRWLGLIWTLAITIFLITLFPAIMTNYRANYQAPRLHLADRALLKAVPGQPIQVVSKSWYSIKLRTGGRAEILNRGKAFTQNQVAASGNICEGNRLLLGPTKSIRTAAVQCGSGSPQILDDDLANQLRLVRLQAVSP